MYISKRSSDFSNIVLVYNGTFTDLGEYVPSSISTCVQMNINHVSNLYDQFLAVGNIPDATVTIGLNSKRCKMPREMALELFGLLEQVWFDYEIGPVDNIPPQSEWTEEYLLSL